MISPVCSRSNPEISSWLRMCCKKTKKKSIQKASGSDAQRKYLKENNLYAISQHHQAASAILLITFLIREQRSFTHGSEEWVHCFVFFLRQGTLALDLDMVTLIYTAQPRTVNHISVLWGSGSDEGSRTTSSAKSREEIMRSTEPNTIFSRIEGQSWSDTQGKHTHTQGKHTHTHPG